MIKVIISAPAEARSNPEYRKKIGKVLTAVNNRTFRKLIKDGMVKLIVTRET
jgi:hypothetical protein